ncbi:MAG: metalloregulator ArsR/SmtB family transcription factor [bacterium]|nr:metalloregulator ArsR/SmtB family transcription factor [bacterium]
MNQIKKIEQFLQVISDEKRMRILKMLEKGPMCICQMTAVLGIKQPTVSKHIKKIKKVGLIFEKRSGNFRLCSLNFGHPLINLWWVVSSHIGEGEIKQDRAKMEEIMKKILIKTDSQSAID